MDECDLPTHDSNNNNPLEQPLSSFPGFSIYKVSLQLSIYSNLLQKYSVKKT